MAPYLLRIAVSPIDRGNYQAEISLYRGGSEEQQENVEFGFALSDQDRELLRWYWEDFLDYPLPPRTEVAAQALETLSTTGTRLFQSVFCTETAREIWKQFLPHQAQNRIELVTPVDLGCAALPWELLQDPETKVTPATECGAFVRRPKAQTRPKRTSLEDGPLRILLVASRPLVTPQPPFRSTACSLVEMLTGDPRHPLQIELLRPPTYAQLSNVLLEADAVGQPFHVLQIDGYGVLADVETDGLPAHLGQNLSKHLCTQVLPGPHGYMLFSNPTSEGSLQLVEGKSLGALMAEAGVPTLVLNACRGSTASFGEPPAKAPVQPLQADVFHSVAADAMEQGVRSVLHLPFNLDMEAAARFLLKIYSWLGQGLSLGKAVNQQRKRLQKHQQRQIAYGPTELQDWPAPVVYEAKPHRLVKGIPVSSAGLFEQKKFGPANWLYANAAIQPAPGFAGMEETLLEMDSVWHTHSIILLQGGPGAGKSAAAAEFARWCRKTDAVDGPVLYTSFEQYQPLASLLDQLAGVFWESLAKAGYRWETLSSDDRIDVALHVLRRVPLLWIWDSVEHISSYPDAEGPLWSSERREDLMIFLQHAEATPARFVLISRQNEASWLEDLSVRIHVPPLAMRERLRLARRVAEQSGCNFQQVEDWRPLLEYTQGNPLAIRCLSACVASEALKTNAQIQGLIEQVRGREATAEADGNDGLNEPLRASISHVLQNGFRKGERRLLALLHLFRGTVDQASFLELGNACRLAATAESEEETEIPNLMEIFGSHLLERAAAYGLLTPHGKGLFTIPPALHSFLAKLFRKYYPGAEKAGLLAPLGVSGRRHGASQEADDAGREDNDEEANEVPADQMDDDSLRSPKTPVEQRSLSSLSGRGRKRDAAKEVKKAFVTVLNEFGESRAHQFESGNSAVTAELDAFESNLLQAIDLARESEWWDLAAGPIKGLGTLYEASGRFARLKDLVERFYPDCADTKAQTALPGREEFWRALTGIAARLARARNRLHTAEAFQSLCARWDRQQAEPHLEAPAEELRDDERRAVRTLAESLYFLGEILRQQGFESSNVDEEAVALRERLNEDKTAAVWARELGQHYTEIMAVRDFVVAERWLRRSLELTDADDRRGRAECLALLGRVSWERFNEARQANQPERDLIRHLNSARKYYQRALVQDPPDDHASLSQHNQELGHVCYALGDLDRALPYYRECIRHAELEGSTARASHARFDLAIALRDSDRLEMAHKYAVEACRGFESLEDSEHQMIDRAKRLVALIEEKVPSPAGSPAAAG